MSLKQEGAVTLSESNMSGHDTIPSLIPISKPTKQHRRTSSKSEPDMPVPLSAPNKIYTSSFDIDVAQNPKALDLKTEHLEKLSQIDSASIKTSSRIIHKPTQTIMVRKTFHFMSSEVATLKTIIRELKTLHKCHSPYIVDYYGSFAVGRSVSLCTEYMDCGSLDLIYDRKGALTDPFLGKITHAVVSALKYLFDEHHIIHREVKPGNILLNSKGEIKITDFSVSPKLDQWRSERKLSNAFMGPEHYTSPEEIIGEPMTSKSDVWNLALIILELALGKFPFTTDTIMEYCELIVGDEPLLKPTDQVSVDLRGFLEKCFVRDVEKRASLAHLAVDAFVSKWAKEDVDMVSFVQDLVIINY